jgi:hypothetical protein
MYCSAELSPCEKYRFHLERRWDITKPVLCFVMLNPSTADAESDDATIRKCIGFAKRWSYGSISIVNLWSYRSTDPKALYLLGSPAHESDDAFIVAKALAADKVICAWGRHGDYRGRGRQVLALLRAAGIRPHAIKVNRDGTPAHPLMLPYESALEPFGWI